MHILWAYSQEGTAPKGKQSLVRVCDFFFYLPGFPTFSTGSAFPYNPRRGTLLPGRPGASLPPPEGQEVRVPRSRHPGPLRGGAQRRSCSDRTQDRIQRDPRTQILAGV